MQLFDIRLDFEDIFIILRNLNRQNLNVYNLSYPVILHPKLSAPCDFTDINV